MLREAEHIHTVAATVGRVYNAAMSAQINTAKAPRRKLRFSSIDDILNETNQLVAAEQNGTLKTSGNWTLGQTINHLAVWIDYAFSGPPMRPPWWVKIFINVFVGKKKFLYEPMRAGVKVPGIPGGALATEVVPTDQAVAHYRTALARLRNEAPQKPNILFGQMTHEEWIALNLRHAELHLSFFSI